jgi:hypothetical protein
VDLPTEISDRTLEAAPSRSCGFALRHSHSCRALLLAGLLLLQTTLGAQSVPPSTPTPTTYTSGAYEVHILENPGARSVPPGERSVLILGLGSGPASVSASRNYYNPATGRRFDVVIGLQSSDANIGTDLTSRVRQDHFDADANASAVRDAIVTRFGKPLVAGVVTTHSNGTPVGVTAVLNGAIQGVAHMNVLGPDIGYGGKYLNAENLAALKSRRGVQSVDIYQNKYDVVPKVGRASPVVLPAIDAATKTLTLGLSDRSAPSPTPSGRATELPTTRQIELPVRVGVSLENHLVQEYLNTIAGFIKTDSPIPPAWRVNGSAGRGSEEATSAPPPGQPGPGGIFLDPSTIKQRTTDEDLDAEIKRIEKAQSPPQ